MMNECQLPYGNRFLTIRFPQGKKVIELKSRHVRGLRNPMENITRSLRSPIGSPALRELLCPDDKVVVIVTDNTRACPDDQLLPPILAEIETRVPSESITIIVALGLHAPLNNDQLIKKLGHRIVARYNVINHDAEDTVNIGFTTRGIPVNINRLVVEADFRLSTGFIEPHFFAGYSGGRKSIFPGVSGHQSIQINHGYEMVSDPLSRTGILEGNPIHEDMVEQARMAKLNFIVNVLLNKKKEITHVVAGDPFVAHERGCAIEKDIASVKVDHQFDIVITTNSGAPLDLDFYQTCKGVENASRITREGGIIIIASACDTGVGPELFKSLHAEADTPQEVLNKIKAEGPIGVQWQNQVLARVQLKNSIYLVSELGDRLAEEMMVKPFPTMENALQKALDIVGNKAEIAVIPEGPLVLPILEE
jgi:nickel-dependent lactate racemase